MEMNYCRRCGAPLTSHSPKEFVCDNGHTIFAASSPAVGIFFITPDKKVILSRRGIEPHKGMLDSIGGFVDDEETLEQAVIREVKEEVGLDKTNYSNLHYLTSAVGHYPYGNEIITVVTAFYWAEVESIDTMLAEDDVAEVIQLDVGSINYEEVHDRDIVIGLQELRKVLDKDS